MATTGTILLMYKDMEPRRSNPNGYHGYHERSRDEVGLHLDSVETLLTGLNLLGGLHNSMKLGK